MYTATVRFYLRGALVKSVTVSECAAPTGAVKGRLSQIARANGLRFTKATITVEG